MTGSLQIKNGKYYMVLNSTKNGKRKQQWVSTGLSEKGNKRKAEKLLRDTLTEMEHKKSIPYEDITVFECVKQWLDKVQYRVDEVTYRGYLHTAQLHILPYFEENGLYLQDCTLQQLQAYFDQKRQNGRKDGTGGLSAKTLRHHKGILFQSLTEAVKEGRIPSNPCQYVVLPQKTRYEANFYTADQLQRLFTALEGDPLLPLVRITVLYGLRRSELLGLKWDSIDFSNGRILIRHTVCQMGNIIAKDKTKSESSRRSFPMTEEAREIFLQAKAEEQRNRRLFGASYLENDYVFKWADGRPYLPDYVTHHFGKVLAKNHLPHIRFHELRHTCASLLLSNGCGLKDVQEWLGHSDIQMTANIYGHLDTARKQSLAQQLTACLNERR